MYITKFQGEWRWLSNFHEGDPFWFEGILWPTAEHAYQAAKTENVDEQERILNAKTPGQTKRLGQRVTLRSDWEEIKDQVMLVIVRAKFQNEALKAKLLGTGDAILIEGNHWGDKFWGKCNGEGLNKLGEILMRVRAELELPF